MKALLIAALASLSLNALADGYRTNSAGRTYYCSTCEGRSSGGSRIDIHVPAGTSQKEINRLLKQATAEHYRVLNKYLASKGMPLVKVN